MTKTKYKTKKHSNKKENETQHSRQFLSHFYNPQEIVRNGSALHYLRFPIFRSYPCIEKNKTKKYLNQFSYFWVLARLIHDD